MEKANNGTNAPKTDSKIIAATGTTTGKLEGNTLKVTPPEVKSEVVKPADTKPEAVKPADKTPEAKKEPEQMPLEDRILKVQILGDLIEKRENLLDSLKKITSYKFKSESREDTLKISDRNGNDFTTSNTEVLKAVVATIKETIQKKLDEVNSQIIF